MTKRTCENCQFAIFKDHGYSNYTVEGSEFICSHQLHPEGNFDRFYGENPKLEYARECSQFVEGAPAELDVDGDWAKDPEILQHIAIRVVRARDALTDTKMLGDWPEY